MLLDKKQFKEFIKSRYVEVDLSQILLAYSKVVVAPQKQKPCMPVAEADNPWSQEEAYSKVAVAPQKPKPCMPVAEADKPYAVDWWPVGPVAEAQETPNTVDDPWSHLR